MEKVKLTPKIKREIISCYRDFINMKFTKSESKEAALKDYRFWSDSKLEQVKKILDNLIIKNADLIKKYEDKTYIPLHLYLI